MERTDELHQAIVEHHRLFCVVYGTASVKIKPHLLMHIPAQMKQLRVNISCFTMERKHGCLKKYGANVSTKTFAITCLKRCAFELLDDVANEPCVDTFLVDPKQSPSSHSFLASLYCDVSPSIWMSKSMTTRLGTAERGTLLLLCLGDQYVVGVAVAFLKCHSVKTHDDPRFLIIFSVCKRLSATEWVRTVDHQICDRTCLMGLLPWLEWRDTLRPLVPAVFRHLLK